MASNSLVSVRVKIDRAKQHLAELNAAIETFRRRQPFEVITDKQTDPRYEIYRFHEREAIPIEWSAIIGDCVHNLRSALDHLAVDLIKAHGSTPGDYAAFPVGSDRQNFELSGITRLNGASADVIDLLRRVKPYKGGNDALWRLHRIDIADKHIMLVPVAAAQTMWGVKWDIREPATEHYPPARMLRGRPLESKFPLKEGDILGSYNRKVGEDIEDKTEFDFGFDIAFGEGQIFDGEPVSPTLTQLINFTERLVDIFARRILKTPFL